jgi:hypothetical protein
MSRLPHFLDDSLTDGGEAVSLMHRPAALYPQEDSWYSFLLRGWVDPRPQSTSEYLRSVVLLESTFQAEVSLSVHFLKFSNSVHICMAFIPSHIKKNTYEEEINETNMSTRIILTLQRVMLNTVFPTSKILQCVNKMPLRTMNKPLISVSD